MSKFLSRLIQKYSFNQINHTHVNMSKRSSFYKPPKFKPRVNIVNNRSKSPNNTLHKNEKVEILVEPIKSESDKKIYKTIKLENGLTALLISDLSRPAESDESDPSDEEPESSSGESSGTESGASGVSESSDQRVTAKPSEYNEEKLAACALCVGVGSYSDPPDIQGLAHFVEHMVFMGSEKYPKENEFDSFIKKKGGSDNASTDCETTTFYFEIQEKYLSHAMDMFSQFFTCPLMMKEAMQREREAIESEFAIAAPSDSNRKDQLLSSLFPVGHPARTFTWGNLHSLRDDLNGDDEKLHSAAHEFRKRHYSGHRMTLAIQARMDLDRLEQYVMSTFGRIPTNNQPPVDFSSHNYTHNSTVANFTGLFYVKPLSDTTEVQLTWCMRSLIKEYESKPHQYISYLLGHEGTGSLLSYLRKKVWALGIYTGNSESGIDYTSMHSLFYAQVVLTKEGLEHIDEVLEAVFSYINMIKYMGPSERIFNEIKTIEETSFRFVEEVAPADHVETLAENMQYFPPQHYITGGRLYYKYDPEGISDLLDYMTPARANIMVLSNKHSTPIAYTSREPWFGTHYRKENVPAKWLERWEDVEPYDCFQLPDPNIYITTDFDLVPPAHPYISVAEKLQVDLQDSSSKDLHKKVEASHVKPQILKQDDLIATVNEFRLDRPNLLRKNNHMEVWYKPDFKFRLPTALLYFYFITPLTLKSPRDSCLLDLWNDVLQQELKEQVYPANMADLSHAIYVGDKGLTLKVNGYSQNLHLVVELISRNMRASTERVSPTLLAAIKDVRARSYYNVLIKPHKLAKDVRMDVLLEPYISPRFKAEQLDNITLDDLTDFSKRFLSKMYLQVLVQGNLAWHDALRISDKVLENIQWQGLPESQLPNLRVHEVPSGSHVVRVRSLNPASTNSVLTNYYQVGPTNPTDTAIIEILMMLMEEPVFNQLRTKEQLGYSVFAMMRYTFGVLGYSVTVNTQVDKFSVTHVDGRIEAFLKKFTRDMRRLTDRKLQATKQSLMQLKHNTDYELKEEVERNWREVVSREYMFHRLFKEADAIETIKASEVKAFVELHFSTGNMTKFRKLSVQVAGHAQDKDSNTTLGEFPKKDYHLSYFTTDEVNGDMGDTSAEFVTDIAKFKKEMPYVPVPMVELAQC